MNRRTLLLVLGSLAFVSHGKAEEAASTNALRDWEPLRALAKLFRDMYEDGGAIADGIDRARYRIFLDGVRAPLSDLLTAKQQVLIELLRADCVRNPAGGDAAADKEARVVITLLNRLQGTVKDLETAVRPGDIRAEVREVEDKLRKIQFQKNWTTRTNQYCELSAAGKDELRSEVQTSIDLVKECQDSLDKLIDRVAKG